MNTWKRAVIYLIKNKVRCMLLLLVLTVISTTMMFSLCLKNGVQESVQNLRETYGSNFVVKEDVKNEGGNVPSLMKRQSKTSAIVYKKQKRFEMFVLKYENNLFIMIN